MPSQQYFRVIFIRLVAICVFWMCGTKIMAQDSCRVLEFSEPMEGRTLKGHVFKKFTLQNNENCQLKCYTEHDCVSYNLGPLKDGKYVCELSDSDDVQHPQDLVLTHGYIYVATKNSCPKSACAATGKCQNGFTDKGYRCKCQSGFLGERCEQGPSWIKVNYNPVCFGARDDDYGSFIVAQTGSITAVKLVHISGSFRCSTTSEVSYWGCRRPAYGTNTLWTIITYANHTVFLPNRRTTFTGDPGKLCASEYTYRLNGFDDLSPELVFNMSSSGAVSVAVNQEFQVWYTQDLLDCSEANNSGRSCVDVYFWFIASL